MTKPPAVKPATDRVRPPLRIVITCECGAKNEVTCTKRQLRHIRGKCSACGKKITVRWSGVRAS